MSRKLCTALLIGVSTLAVATPVAYAQDAETSVGVGEIIVTAQRRAQSLQDTPVSVSAVTAQELSNAGAVTTADIPALVPGVVFNNNLTAALPYIRGVGQNTGSVGVESPVAFYLDGVYLVQPASGLFSFNNVERIEVLRGPQGTLFGRNTTGGVIQVVTRAPSATFDAYGSVGYARFDTVSADGYVTGEVAPNLATSVAAYVNLQREGHIRNQFLNRDIGESENYGIQNRWLWTPTNDTEIGLSLLYNWKLGYQGTTNSVYPGTVADDGVSTFQGYYVTEAAIPTQNRDAQALGALTVHQDFGWAQFTSTTSWHGLWDRFNFVQNAIQIHTPIIPGEAAVTQYIWGKGETLTQEFQLAAPADADFQWMLGVFYLHDRTQLDVADWRDNQFIFQGSAAANIESRQTTESFAVYLDGSRTILPNTRLTLGVRYTEDEKRIYGSSESINASSVVTPSAWSPAPTSWEELSYRAVLDYRFSEDILAYISYNRGFKSGLYNISFALNPPVDPEIVDAYEAGLKTELFDNRLRLNFAAFHYDYEGVQLRQTVSQFPGRFFLLNAADAEVEGLEIDFVGVPTANLTIRGGISLLDATYTSFPGAPFALPNPVTLPLPAGCTLLTPALPPAATVVGGNTSVACDLSGYPMIRSPEVTANLGFSYDQPLGNGSVLTFNVHNNYNSGFYWDPDQRTEQDAYNDLRASLVWTAPSGRWDLSVWGRNLLDEIIFASATAGSTTTFAIGEPRTYGVRLSFRH